ncbi:aminotransferase class V-fold PLP-dependent enzyme [Sphingopyxis panaciterrae]
MPAATSAKAASVPSAGGKIALPDRANYRFEGIHLNAAYTHPVGIRTTEASRRYIEARMTEPAHNWPAENSRNDAVALYAKLINAEPGEIAIVPSTLEGENLIAAALGLGPGRGVVSDSLHYDASLVLYGEMAKHGMPLTVLSPRDHAIDYDELERAITPQTKLVAISHVSSWTGHKHDLKRVCDIAHAKGAYVYADVIQSVGGIPLDVKESGIDFCCAGMYKWLQGEFGAAFLYVRPDRLAELKRTQIGWRGIKSYQPHFMPSDPPGPPVGDWSLGTDTASIFEVSTTNWSGLATTAGALQYIHDIGIDAMVRHRDPMLQRLQEELPRAGWSPWTPRAYQGPTVTFSRPDAGKSFRAPLAEAKIYTTLYANRIRISPSVHNSMDDIEKLIAILTRTA